MVEQRVQVVEGVPQDAPDPQGPAVQPHRSGIGRGSNLLARRQYPFRAPRSAGVAVRGGRATSRPPTSSSRGRSRVNGASVRTASAVLAADTFGNGGTPLFNADVGPSAANPWPIHDNDDRAEGDDEGSLDDATGNSKLKKLRNGPLEWLDQFEVMFAQVAVDGSTSCIPGEQMGDENDEGDEQDQNKGHSCDDGPPRSNYHLKRGNSTCTTATSPKKKSKSPIVRIMKGMLETMQTHYAIAQKVMQGELKTGSIKKAMRLSVECGAVEGSVEHFVASQLFVKAEHRDVFFTIETKEGRLASLKWWCQKKMK